MTTDTFRNSFSHNIIDYEVDVRIKVHWREPPVSNMDKQLRIVGQNNIDVYAARLAQQIEEALKVEH